MKVVIEVSEDFYNISKMLSDRGLGNYVEQCVAKGEVLPKGHGRLIDVSEYFKKEFGDARAFLDKASTIIEADTESEETDADSN